MADLPCNFGGTHELLTCGICAEPYDDGIHQAKFLSCFHTFCSDCLTKLLNNEPFNLDVIQCPSCRSNTGLADNRIDGLQTNFYIANFQEICKNTDPPKNVDNLLGCHGHNDKPISHFCVTCGLYICRYCATLAHSKKNSHSVISTTNTQACYLQELNVSHTSVVQNNKNLQLIEYEMAILTAAKETAIKDMETFIKMAHEKLEQHRDMLLNSILDQFNAQQIILQDKQGQIQEVRDMLNTNVTEATDLTKIGNLRKLKPIHERLRKLNEQTQFISSTLDLGANYLAFDSNKGLEEFNKSLGELGQIYSKGFLPSMVVFKCTEATVGHKVTLDVEACNHHGDPFLVSPDTFSVQVIDPAGTELQAVLCTSGSECTMTFTPECCGLHEVSGIFLGQRLINEETHIAVGSNDPVLKFGGK